MRPGNLQMTIKYDSTSLETAIAQTADVVKRYNRRHPIRRWRGWLEQRRFRRMWQRLDRFFAGDDKEKGRLTKAEVVALAVSDPGISPKQIEEMCNQDSWTNRGL